LDQILVYDLTAFVIVTFYTADVLKSHLPETRFEDFTGENFTFYQLSHENSQAHYVLTIFILCLHLVSLTHA